MSLDNRELVSFDDLAITLCYCKCSKCGFLQDDSITNTNTLCSHCGCKGTSPEMFPNLNAITLFEIVQGFCRKGYQASNNNIENTLKEIRNKTKIKINKHQLNDIHKELSVNSYEKMLNIICREFTVSNKQAKEIYTILLQTYPKRVDEYISAVILTCTLLENLLNEFLYEMLECRETSSEVIDIVLNEAGSIPAKFKIFKRLNGSKFSSVLNKIDAENFCGNWEELRKARNKLIHGNPYVIGERHANIAFQLAKDSFSVFAMLHNRSCLKAIKDVK
ncbi:MAG: hypothetical protein Q7J67_06445 [bacterium]|nr:hypothetical protein [bacterium]